VGRIRYLGMVLYDADMINEVATQDDDALVDAQRRMILDPHDPEVVRRAREAGIHDSVIESAQRSPVYRFVKDWGLALPLHIEYRTLPMLFYVPPLLPILGNGEGDVYDTTSSDFFGSLDRNRLPVEYLARLFSAGNVGKIRYALRKMMAVRYLRRQETVGDVGEEKLRAILAEADTTAEEAEAIYRLTSLPTFDERFVIPPMHREEAISALTDPLEFKGAAGFGFITAPARAP
jgi:nitrate reductase / nitrite oxidoreductase, beta subunit